MGLDDAALGIGRAIVKQAVGAWLGIRRERGRRSQDLVTLLEVAVVDAFHRRDLARRLEDIGDQAAQRLRPLYDAEFRDIPENERLAAMNAVIDALSAADLDDHALFRADADPVSLAREVRHRVPGAIQQAGLSDGAAQFYCRVLDDSCVALVSIVRRLPEFQPAAITELLSRTTSLADDIGQVLERLPRTSLDAPRGTDHDADFRRRYLESVSTQLEALELFGIDVHRYRPRTQVSVAYFSLTVAAGDRPLRHRGKIGDDDWFGRRQRHRDSSVRVEDALAERPRTFLRGEAGSGKTTLLQWLAVNCARGSFVGQLAQWNGRVPFLVRLRSHADRPLPQPEQFLGEVGSMSVGIMPDGWVHRQLREHAVLLVDGVDELVPTQRRAVRNWLGQVGNAFPDLPIVVTSRPGAAGRSWLDEHGFGSVLLEPMSPTDITEFCRRWHLAIRQATAHDHSLLPCPPDKLNRYEASLLRHFDTHRHLRAIASSPLLCAMLCALNLDRNMQLPPDRMSLYDAALNLLLERRDTEREIPAAGQLRMSAKAKIATLQHLAWRLTDAGRAEITFDDCVEHVRRAINRLHSVQAEPEPALRYLLERSGVIRQPVLGRIDFVHRTFQEYLSGKEAAEDHLPGVLVRHADSDQWRETIVMAAGHGTPKYRSALLGELLTRADREPARARELRLLATACLETAHTVDAQVTQRVDAALKTVLPPRSTRESRSLARAGARVIDKLPSSLEELSEASAAACVRAVALINGTDALRLLASYASDPRQFVQIELAEAWRYFDAEEYANTVLSNAPLRRGMIVVRRPEHLAHVGQLAHLDKLWIILDDPVKDLNFLGGVPHLENVQCDLDSPLLDLTPLLTHSELQYIGLRGRGAPGNLLRGLSVLPELRYLSVTVTDTSTGFVADFPELNHLVISFYGVADKAPLDVSPIGCLNKLTHLSISNCPSDPSAAIAELRDLSSLELYWTQLSNGLAGIRPLLPRLARLHLWGCPIKDLSLLRNAVELQTLYIGRTYVAGIEPISTLPKLRHLYLFGCASDLDVSPLVQLPRRARIYLSRGQDVGGLTAVRHRHRISWI